MRTRIKKQFWFSEEENRELKRKAALAGLTEVAVVRMLLKGYEPREKPEDRFYDAMTPMWKMGNNFNQLVAKANALNYIDTQWLKDEARKWAEFQLDIQHTFLLPEKSKLKWE